MLPNNLPDIFSQSNLPIRERIAATEAAMLREPQILLETTHTFGGGMYARTIRIPQGTMLSGEIHKFEHLNIVSKGHISVVTENGWQEVFAGDDVIVSQPGTKRIGYAHEDTVWTTIHATTETDVDKIRAIFIAKDHSELLHLEGK